MREDANDYLCGHERNDQAKSDRKPLRVRTFLNGVRVTGVRTVAMLVVLVPVSGVISRNRSSFPRASFRGLRSRRTRR